MAYVYRHIRLDKNMPFYIGIGSDKGYYRAHDSRKRTVWWKRVVAKTDYDVEIMLDDISFQDACKKEIELIALYGRVDNKTGILVNQTNGGQGTLGQVTKPERRLALSKRATGNKHCVGRVMSNETKLRIKNALVGCAPTTGRPVIQYDINGRYVNEYKSANEVERKTNIVASNITATCRKRMRGKHLYKKFIWRYKDEIALEYGSVVDKINITENETPVVRSMENLRKGSKLDMAMADEIRNSNLSGIVLAKKYGVTSTCIYAIKNGETWVK